MRKLVALAAVVWLAGCLHATPPTRAQTRTPVTVAFVVDDPHGQGVTAPPPEFVKQVTDQLDALNLEPNVVPFEAFQQDFDANHDTRRRFREVVEKSPAPLVLLVETQASFFGLLEGRYRWTVSTKLTLGKREAPDDAVQKSFDLPSILTYEHEKVPQALNQVAPTIAERAGRMFDAFISKTEKTASAERTAPELPGYDSVYFILVDRYANGDPSNDGTVDLQDPAAFHGGDLQGVIDHLDDLQKLGVKTVWLSPVWKMRTEKFFGHGAFHGYWVEDYSQVEPRFGNLALLRKLSDALHARNMKLYLDVVLNHVSFDSPLVKEHPDWFHHEGDLKDWNDPEQLVNRDVMGLPDLAQENPAVYQFLWNASSHWYAAAKPDGFRLDAVKHIPLWFWRRFNHDMRQLAGPNFELLGEDLEGDPKVLSKTAREGDFSAVFDFPLHYALVDVFCKGASPVKLASVLSQDRLYPDANKLVTVLDNHDLPRILTDCKGDEHAVENALTFQMTARGVPAITYGTEAGLTGEREPENRGDMKFDSSFPLKGKIAQLLGTRRSHEALLSGASEIVSLDPKVFAYARIAPDEAVEIAVNGSDQWAHVPLPEGLPAHAVPTDLYSGLEVPTGDFAIEPHAVRAFSIKAATADGFAARAKLAEARWLHPSERRAVQFTAAGGHLEVVGSASELGAWDPKSGVALKQGSATVQLPVGAVVELKLVRREGAKVDWAPGDNHFLWVKPGSGPLEVPLAWAAGPQAH